MAGNKADYFVTESKAAVGRILAHVEAAQAEAAALYQEYNALGGNAVLNGYVWPEGYTQANFETFIYKLNLLFPGILSPTAGMAGGHAADFYKVLANL